MRKLAKKADLGNSNVFLETGIDINNRIIHLFNDIDNLTVSEVIKGLQLMIIRNKEPISIYINSFGGCVYSGLGLYDFIKSLEEVIVRTYVVGTAMSMGSIILMAGDERYMYKNSTIMLHTISTFSDGKIFELNTDNDECKKLFKQMCDIYASDSVLSSKEWINKLKYKNIHIRPEEALKLKLITGIVGVI